MSVTEIFRELDAARVENKILESTLANVRLFFRESTVPPLYVAALLELVRGRQWAEINDRFFRTLAFGTGGLRGRTIGRIVTAAERGTATESGPPEHPCVGTNAMNTYNIVRATLGLVEYLKDWHQTLGADARKQRPKLVIAYDVRHFSRTFADLAARVATESGCDAALFQGPRSTPELSFAVRMLDADAGVVITASHNPPHDNGFKVYFNDGAQIVEPHASEIIKRVNAIASEVYTPVPEPQRGQIQTLGQEVDSAYMERLETLVLDRAMVTGQKSQRIVFSPIHGTGGIISVPVLQKLGFAVNVVETQSLLDGAFPTVKSPNPENAEALQIAIAQADATGADIVLATDPDADRLGVAVRNRQGTMILLTGNQIASLIAHYRVTKLREQGVLTDSNARHFVIIKTVVTTDLLAAIAAKHGLHCVETLTGFKYIGEKLGKYEKALPPSVQTGYARKSEQETRAARLSGIPGTYFYVFGGEESYGYSGADFVRDKDGNGSAIMFAESAAYAASRSMTVDELLDDIYATYGYFLERNGSLTFEGAEGAAKIAKLAQSYAQNPPTAADGSPVVAVKDFANEQIRDADGDVLPRESMIQFWLADGRRVAVRPSGTEPKIKFYMFAKKEPPIGSRFTLEEVALLKVQTPPQLESLWSWIQSDVENRLAH